MSSEVRVFCQDCGDELWKGTLIDWVVELSKNKPPKWFLKAYKHGKTLSHRIMVQYPSITVSLAFGITGEMKT